MGGVVQCVAVCCSVLQYIAVEEAAVATSHEDMLKWEVHCSALQCIAVYCSVLQCGAACSSVLKRGAVCAAVCCSAP